MSKLAESTLRFMARFNDRGVEGIVSSFSAVGCYTDPQGTSHWGREALRRAFTPLFDSSFGSNQYDIDEYVLHDEQEKPS